MIAIDVLKHATCLKNTIHTLTNKIFHSLIMGTREMTKYLMHFFPSMFRKMVRYHMTALHSYYTRNELP